MKKYDHETRRWISEEEFNAKNGKKQRCKNNKEHNYILVLPDYITETDERYQFTPELYYDTMNRIADFERAQYAFLESKGIILRTGRPRYRSQTYVCTKCYKKHYKSDDR